MFFCVCFEIDVALPLAKGPDARDSGRGGMQSTALPNLNLSVPLAVVDGRQHAQNG